MTSYILDVRAIVNHSLNIKNSDRVVCEFWSILVLIWLIQTKNLIQLWSGRQTNRNKKWSTRCFIFMWNIMNYIFLCVLFEIYNLWKIRELEQILHLKCLTHVVLLFRFFQDFIIASPLVRPELCVVRNISFYLYFLYVCDYIKSWGSQGGRVTSLLNVVLTHKKF